MPFVIGFDGGAGETGSLVERVRSLKETYGFAADTVRAIGSLVRAGETALEAGELEEVGRLMDFNHGLLEALGVSAHSLDEMVWVARDAGALGAKLTGAGGSGCIVALDANGDIAPALAATPVCQEVFHVDVDTDGLRREA